MENARNTLNRLLAHATAAGHRIEDAVPDEDGTCEPYFSLALGGELWVVEADYAVNAIRVKDWNGRTVLELPAARPAVALLRAFDAWCAVQASVIEASATNTPVVLAEPTTYLIQ